MSKGLATFRGSWVGFKLLPDDSARLLSKIVRVTMVTHCPGPFTTSSSIEREETNTVERVLEIQHCFQNIYIRSP